MVRTMTSRVAFAFVSMGLAILGCEADKATAVPSEPAAAAPPTVVSAIETDKVRAHVMFLADDAQEGRAPGTEADGRVQGYVESALKSAGFEPGFGDSYRQSFSVTDGVRVREGGEGSLTLAGAAVESSLLPFSTDTTQAGATEAKLVFVGYGIAGEDGKGDYKGLDAKIKGKIVVAFAGGPNDPHIAPLKLRPQSKLIAARDRGAAGFILWDPTSTVPHPNHGEANDLTLPALFVGAGGNTALLAAFGKKEVEKMDVLGLGLRNGKTSRKRARLQTDVERVELSTANVAAFLPGSGADPTVLVVGAHMDHLGMGTASSLAPGERAIHNGADDNASGVAVMLEVCRGYASRPLAERPRGLLCAAFGAEEMGLLGSKYMVEHITDATKDPIVAMVNFDMVGRLRENTLSVAGVGTSSVWPALVEGTKGELGVATTEDGYGPSDHGSFYEAGIPVLHFFTGAHEDYHKPSDDIDKLNFDGAAAIGTMALAVVEKVANTPTAPDYKKTKRSTKQGGRVFRVSLGTIPDYAAQVDGVRLSGVREGGAAANAGLQKGDVIKKVGAREIHNLDDFMATFGELVPGEPVQVVIEREGATQTLPMTPAAPRPR